MLYYLLNGIPLFLIKPFIQGWINQVQVPTTLQVNERNYKLDYKYNVVDTCSFTKNQEHFHRAEIFTASLS